MNNIFFIMNITLFVAGILLFSIRTILFFRSKSYEEQVAMNALATMRVGILLVMVSIAGFVSSQLGQSPLAIINTMILVGLIVFLLLLLFTAQLSKWLSVLAIRADLQKMQQQDGKEAPKVMIVEEPYADDE
ncbi:hypothetical protein PVA45_00260 [Entomospira entomophila]|uniref:Uncharacterized protein n=1 Tax=Entomospira entomophila TaxID=2719988 RepID=A0A968GAR9_9SPIO|nr:hypothetical protein [Entomospira entomophilus]NIZ39956.1 hypothetical protein [Entomospira entomophilus]WDI35517.1 hypothetical protein PVA45_00260 [Entomospira entomophilus]